ncbi:hypothetical protein HK405_010177 [Cladochytrium tenue]|nr:hypothetical protein HK405_010177 [Cladochytrium tenue]
MLSHQGCTRRGQGQQRRRCTAAAAAVVAIGSLALTSSSATPALAVPTDLCVQGIRASLVSTLTWQSTILGLIGIGAGLLIAVQGYMEKQKHVRFTFGFVDAATVAAIVAWNSEPSNGYNTRGVLYPVVLGVSGLVGGILCVFLPLEVSRFTHTGIGAVALLLWLNTLHSGGLVVSGLARGLGFAVLPVGAGLLSLYVDQRFVMPAAASVAGLLLTAVGVDSFLRCGYAFGMVASMTAGEIGEAMLKDYELTTAPLVLATLAAGFALTSLIYIILRDRAEKKKIKTVPKPKPPQFCLEVAFGWLCWW